MTLMTIPLDERSKLNARALGGSREQLSAMQTDFADRVARPMAWNAVCKALRRTMSGSRGLRSCGQSLRPQAADHRHAEDAKEAEPPSA